MKAAQWIQFLTTMGMGTFFALLMGYLAWGCLSSGIVFFGILLALVTLGTVLTMIGVLNALFNGSSGS